MARETMNWRDGHTVEWAFMWDTEGFADASPTGNVRISVRAMDHGEDMLPSGIRPTPIDYVARNLVDIVPYVTGFIRHGPDPASDMRSYSTIRSMQGWYSFYQGESRITALGWNLNGVVANAPAGAMGGAGIALAGPAGTGAPTNADAPGNRTSPIGGFHIGGRNVIMFGVPAAAESGRISFTIGGTEIHNHRSNPGRDWNRENLMPDGRSAYWTNRPYAHVWRTGPTDTTSGAGAGAHIPRTFMGPFDNTQLMDHPGMALEYIGGNAGLLHGAWGVFGTAMVHYGTNVRGTVVSSGAALYQTRLTAATPYDPFVTPDISLFNGGGEPNVAFVHMHDNTSNIRMRSNVFTQASGDGTTTANFPNLVAGAAGGGPRRWQNIRTAKAAVNSAAGNPGRLLTTVYDASNRSLAFSMRFGAGDVGATPTAAGGIAQNASNIVFFIDGQLGLGDATDRVARSGNAGLFSAVGYDGVSPIVAYYDFDNDTLRIAFAATPGPELGAGGSADTRRTAWVNSWQRQNVLERTDALFRGSGRYVSMAVDRAGGIHLAFFNTRLGALVYAYAEPRTTANPVPNFVARIVDTMDGVGTWTDISVDHWGNPWIVYGYQGRQGNFDGIRMAFRSRNADGHGGGLEFTARDSWEAVQMPAPFRTAYDRLNIEAWPPSNRAAPNNDTPLSMANAHRVGGVGTGREWNAAIGYASGAGDNRFRIGYFFRPELGPTNQAWPPPPVSPAPLP